MLLLEEKSINRWAQSLRNSPEKAELIGYESPEKTPAPSTYYKFIYRILDYYNVKRPTQITDQVNIISNTQNDPFKPSDEFRHHSGIFRDIKSKEKRRRDKEEETGQKQRREEGVTFKKLEEVRDWNTAQMDFVQLINRLLLQAVKQSILMGVLPPPNQLALCVDGTLYKSQGSSYGNRRCECAKNKKCKCPKSYSDPTAAWGYCKTKDEFVFGHRVSGIVARGETAIELPVQVIVSPPQVGEEPLCVEGLARLWQEKLGLDLGGRKSIFAQYLVADLGYCGAAIHQCAQDFGLKPVIPLLEVSHTKQKDKKSCTVDRDSIPRCPSGQEMKKHFTCAKRGTCFRCPVRWARRRGSKVFYEIEHSRCDLAEMCDPTSKIGPTIYVREGTYHRLNPEIPRDSEEFKELYNRRGSVERFFSRLKCSSGAVETRRSPILQFMAVIRAIACHVQAWMKILV